MRKLVVLVITLSLNMVAFGQRAARTMPIEINSINNSGFTFVNSNARTAGEGDTLVLSNIPATDSLLIYPLDPFGTNAFGYFTGTDTFNDMGFAERYDINGGDSSLVVIGVISLFHGTVNPLSTKTVTFNAWDVSPQYVISATFAYSGFPNNDLDSLVIPITQLGIGTTADTLKTFLFPTYTDTIVSSFFVGYTINYNFQTLNGDTLGLACSENGDRSDTVVYTITTYIDSILNAEGSADSAIFVTDTVVNVRNATQWADYTWNDNYTQSDSLFNDLAIYPIVVIYNATGIKGVTRKNLTFFGNYPNPAVDNTNIKFSLLQDADVTIQVMDMKGSIISTISNSNLSVGDYIIPVNTSSMPSGDYIYFIHTSLGDGIAGKMTIVR